MPIEPLARDILTAWGLGAGIALTPPSIGEADRARLQALRRDGGNLPVTLALAHLLTPNVASDLRISVSPLAGFAVAGWWTVGTAAEPLFAALRALGWAEDLGIMNAVAAGWCSRSLRCALTATHC